MIYFSPKTTDNLVALSSREQASEHGKQDYNCPFSVRGMACTAVEAGVTNGRNKYMYDKIIDKYRLFDPCRWPKW